MVVLSAAQVVLADRVLTPGTLTLEGDRIVDVREGRRAAGRDDTPRGSHCIVPGFVDVHVHGVEGLDVLAREAAVASMAARLPRYGVTGFCPTTVACAPAPLRSVLAQVRQARLERRAGAARVLPAHLESNFINPAYRGAQPAVCLRSAGPALRGLRAAEHAASGAGRDAPEAEAFAPEDILREIDRARDDVAIVTVAPEIDGGLDLVRWLSARGHRVSLGHSGATFEEGLAAIAAGARQATHLFNRMPPLNHRVPGLVGAVLQSDEVAAELICDGVHVHPSMMRVAVAAKRAARVMAITDGTAVSGLPAGSVAHLGGQRITATGSAAVLDDGTLAGSTLTMDAAFRMLVNGVGCSLVDAAAMCAGTPAREVGLGESILAAGAPADLVVLDADLEVLQTYVGGKLAYARIGNRDL
jgi:N-acetylglucosamine-6-phosphate deacetylase